MGNRIRAVRCFTNRGPARSPLPDIVGGAGDSDAFKPPASIVVKARDFQETPVASRSFAMSRQGKPGHWRADQRQGHRDPAR